MNPDLLRIRGFRVHPAGCCIRVAGVWAPRPGERGVPVAAFIMRESFKGLDAAGARDLVRETVAAFAMPSTGRLDPEEGHLTIGTRSDGIQAAPTHAQTSIDDPLGVRARA